MIDGGDGADTLTGNVGDDTLLGGLGADTLVGGGGADLVDGGQNDDLIILDGSLVEMTLGNAGADADIGSDTAVDTFVQPSVLAIEIASGGATHTPVTVTAVSYTHLTLPTKVTV